MYRRARRRARAALERLEREGVAHKLVLLDGPEGTVVELAEWKTTA